MIKYLLIILLLVSCTKESYTPIGDIAKIEQESRSLSTITYYEGGHISNHGYITYPMNEWSSTVVFTESCRYETNDPLNQDDWNKLFGVRKSALSNTKNGAYLVWCYVPYSIIASDTIVDKIRIGWYLHDDDGDFIPMPLNQTIYVNLNTPVYLYLKNYYNNFVYNLNGQNIPIMKGLYNIDNFSNGWRLSPNFGGQEVPDHNVIITINN
jgi:hypothetical protein